MPAQTYFSGSYFKPKRAPRAPIESDKPKKYGNKTKPSVKSEGFKPFIVGTRTMVDALAEMGTGNSSLERAIDGAAKYLGIQFDAYQYYVPLSSTGLESTSIDFVMFNPRRAIFADGIQHELRPDTYEDDIIRRGELERLGWIVVAIKESDFIIDPFGQVGRVIYG